jgi:hypothetical protein
MKWLKDLGSVCSDDNGFFSLTVTDKTGKLFEKYEGQALFLTVSKDGKEIIHREKEPLYLEVGTIEYRQIILGEKECPPPSPEPEKETWTVKGTVRNKAGKKTPVPLPGVTVRISDRVNKFAKLLGERVTDQNGGFEFIYEIVSLNALLKADPPLFITVLDQSGKQLYTSPDPIHCKAGHVEELEIVI